MRERRRADATACITDKSVISQIQVLFCFRPLSFSLVSSLSQSPILSPIHYPHAREEQYVINHPRDEFQGRRSGHRHPSSRSSKYTKTFTIVYFNLRTARYGSLRPAFHALELDLKERAILLIFFLSFFLCNSTIVALSICSVKRLGSGRVCCFTLLFL